MKLKNKLFLDSWIRIAIIFSFIFFINEQKQFILSHVLDIIQNFISTAKKKKIFKRFYIFYDGSILLYCTFTRARNRHSYRKLFFLRIVRIFSIEINFSDSLRYYVSLCHDIVIDIED